MKRKGLAGLLTVYSKHSKMRITSFPLPAQVGLPSSVNWFSKTSFAGMIRRVLRFFGSCEKTATGKIMQKGQCSCIMRLINQERTSRAYHLYTSLVPPSPSTECGHSGN